MANLITPRVRTKIKLEGAKDIIGRILSQHQLGVRIDEKYLSRVLREIRMELKKYEEG